MWGRLKRRILRTKAGTGGVYNSSSHDDEFSDSRDTYRDFREELYDDSRGSGTWKDGGGRSGKRTSLTKTPFPNLDRCSCGTPGGRDLQDNVAKSETLRRKNDFILGADGKARDQTKGRIVGKANNEYTSTSTGPGTRCRAVGDDGGGEQRLRASTSTGQIPCGALQSEEQARNEWNNRRRNGHSPGAPERRRRLAYSDNDDDESDDESEEEDEDDDEEEDEEGEGERVPSTSQAFRNSSQSEGTKSSSNSSDYTSLAFDLNYVKVSPPKLRRRRKKNAAALSPTTDKSSAAPLMVRRERRPFPEISASSSCDHLLSARAVPLKRSVGESGNRKEVKKTSDDVLRLEGVDAGRRTTSKEAEVQSIATPFNNDATSCRQPAVLLSSFTGTKPQQHQQQQSSEYVAWADIHNPPRPLTSLEGGRNICEVSGSARVGGDEERVIGRGREISTSGSVLQFTFTVRLDNDVIRGTTRRDVDGSSGAVVGGGSGSSMVSGRVDILNQEKPGGGASISGRGTVLSPDQYPNHHHQQQGYIPGSESMGLLQRSFKVQMQDDGAQVGTQNVTSSQERMGAAMLTETSNVSTDPKDPTRPVFKDTTQSVSQQQQIVQTVGVNELNQSPKTGSVEVSGRQQRVDDDFVCSQGSRMTTVAIVHKSASDYGDRDETNGALTSRKELGPTDGHSHAGDALPEAESGGGPRKSFDEVDSCIGSKSHQCQASPPLGSTTEDETELTHMSWEEVMKEAQSLGIPLSRPSGSSGERARQSTGSTGRQVLSSSNSPPTKQGPSLQDVYFVCSSCTENMQQQHQSSSHAARKTPPSKTSSPFKEKFKLQSIFGSSSNSSGGGGGGGGKKPKEDRTCRGKATPTSSSPLSRNGQSSKYRTMPIPSGTKDIVLWSDQNCTCTTRRSLQKARQRSLSPVSSTRCSQAVQSSSPKAAGLWGRGGDKRGQRVSHLCSPPLLRCRFPSSGRTIQTSNCQSSSWNLKKSAHLSSEMLTSSSSPVIRRANDNDRDFLKSLAQLMGCSWYWGTLSFEAAEAELMDRPDGAFLVRDSSDDRYILSVSFRSQRSTHHVRIERHNGMFSFSSEHGLHESPDIVEFVEHAVELSQNGQCLYYLRPRQLNLAPVPVQLIYPVSRFAH